MKPSLTRRLSIALMLACAGAQPALSPSLVASALALGFHSSDHTHSVLLQPDRGHIDVVLSHGDEPREHGHPASYSEGDHVVHISDGGIATATARRAVVHSPLAFAIPFVRPLEVARVWLPSRSPALQARGVDQLRTIVLLI